MILDPRAIRQAQASMAARLTEVVPTLTSDACDATSLFALAFAARGSLSAEERRTLGEEFNAMYSDPACRYHLMAIVFPVLPRDERGPEHWGMLRADVVDGLLEARAMAEDGEFIMRIAEQNSFVYEVAKADIDGGGFQPYLVLFEIARVMDETPLDPRVPDFLEHLEAAYALGGRTRATILTGFIEDLEPRWLRASTRPVPFPPGLAAAADAEWAPEVGDSN